MKLEIRELGRRPYEAVWDLQKDLAEKRWAGAAADTLLFVEHPDVITLGRRGTMESVLAEGIPVHKIERGGLATYHGPGQLVGYPIVHLQENGLNLAEFLRRMEGAVIEALAVYGITGAPRPRLLPAGDGINLTGVWVGERKICSIGISVKRWVTFHGFALNVNTDLAKFRAIRPCGMSPEVMTSMAEVLGHEIDILGVQDALRAAFTRAFATQPALAA